ncbi:hypothetical protein MVEN_02209100 [Mycena venus]|uniref:Uncharacterized protein n=1 Tax=Mycena venus TaxID=2733690 RepID=A0A8H6X6T3_9AGAR|nr:hypothetical protein MVEN_02209100 [Mycena venus]
MGLPPCFWVLVLRRTRTRLDPTPSTRLLRRSLSRSNILLPLLQGHISMVSLIAVSTWIHGQCIPMMMHHWS